MSASNRGSGAQSQPLFKTLGNDVRIVTEDVLQRGFARSVGGTSDRTAYCRRSAPPMAAKLHAAPARYKVIGAADPGR